MVLPPPILNPNTNVIIQTTLKVETSTTERFRNNNFIILSHPSRIDGSDYRIRRRVHKSPVVHQIEAYPIAFDSSNSMKSNELNN